MERKEFLFKIRKGYVDNNFRIMDKQLKSHREKKILQDHHEQYIKNQLAIYDKTDSDVTQHINKNYFVNF